MINFHISPRVMKNVQAKDDKLSLHTATGILPAFIREYNNERWNSTS